MSFSFQEKSIFGSLVITIGLFSYFFIAVFEALASPTEAATARLPGLLIGVVIAVIVVEATYHILIAILSRPEDEDERDRTIEAKATRISYFVLVAGLLTAVGHSLLAAMLGFPANEQLIEGPVLLASLVVCAFILAEVVGFAMQLYYYRRGF